MDEKKKKKFTELNKKLAALQSTTTIYLNYLEMIQDEKRISDHQAKLTAQKNGLEFIQLPTKIALDLLMSVPIEVMMKNTFIPVEKDNGPLEIACSSTIDPETLDLLRFRLNTEIKCFISSHNSILNMIRYVVAEHIGNQMKKQCEYVEKMIETMNS